MNKKEFFAGFITTLLATHAMAAEKTPMNKLLVLEKNSTTSSLISLSKDSKLKELKSIKLPNGKIKAKFQQLYQQVPVYGYTLTANKTNQDYTNWHGFILKKIKADITTSTPKLSKQQAITTLKNAYPGLTKNDSYNEQATLYVKMTKSKKAQLVYLTSFVIGGKNPQRPTGFVDANTGKVISSWNGLTTKEARGPGGNEKTGKYLYGTDFPKMTVTDDCIMSTKHVDTVNLNHATSGGSVYQFEECNEDAENLFKEINGAYSPMNDAHYFGNIVFKMYSDWYNTAPLNFKLKMRVHYSNNYENAFWDGQQMTFGDGANRFYPLVSLDVASHEVSHGFTE